MIAGASQMEMATGNDTLVQTTNPVYISNEKMLSPHPREYFLLADKKRQHLLKKCLEDVDSELRNQPYQDSL